MGEINNEKFRRVIDSMWNKVTCDRFDQLYRAAFLRREATVERHSCLAFSTFRDASASVKREAVELSIYAFGITVGLFRDFYSIYPQRSCEELSIEEKVEIQELFVVWSKTSLITRVLLEGQFKKENLVAFLEESMSEMTDYVINGGAYEIWMYNILLEALASENISREEFLVQPEEQREAYAMKILAYHINSRLRKSFGL